MITSVKIGNCSYALTAKEIVFNRNRETGDSVTLSYEVPEESAMNSLPELGSSTVILSGVVLDKITVTPGTAGMTTVKLEYNSPDYSSSDDDDDDDGDDESTETEEGSIVEQSLEGSVSDEPILTHPNFTSLSTDKLEYLKAIMDGARMWEKVTVLNTDGSEKKNKAGRSFQRTLSSLVSDLSDDEKSVGKLLLKGVQSYRCPGATWREKRYASSGDVNIDGLGKISSPSGAPTPSGRNWMMIGKNVSKNSDGNSWTIETTYELSGPNGWEEALYS